jgi:predicted nucleic-acid-binding Zn-ribbon protein
MKFVAVVFILWPMNFTACEAVSVNPSQIELACLQSFVAKHGDDLKIIGISSEIKRQTSRFILSMCDRSIKYTQSYDDESCTSENVIDSLYLEQIMKYSSKFEGLDQYGDSIQKVWVEVMCSIQINHKVYVQIHVYNSGEFRGYDFIYMIDDIMGLPKELCVLPWVR